MRETMKSPTSYHSYIQALIEKHDLVVFSKNNCVFCDKIMKYLTETLGISNSLIHKENLEEKFGPEEFIDYAYSLFDKTKSNTFPQLFIGGIFYGGFKDLVDLHQFKCNELETIMQSVGITLEPIF